MSSADQPSFVVSSVNSATICGEHGLRVVDQIDLVDREHQLRHTEQRHHRGVPASLLDHTFAGVDQQDHQLCRRSTGDGVAGVLHVAGRIGQHEGPLGRREVAVGDIDGDALFPLRTQAVDQQRQIRGGQALVHRGAGDRVDLIGQHRFRVVQQPSDQCGLAVVDAAGGGETEEIGLLCLLVPQTPLAHQKYPSRLRSSMAASETRSSPRVAPRSVSRDAATSARIASLSAASDRIAPVVDPSPTVR